MFQKYTVEEIRLLLNDHSLSKHELNELKKDTRKGVQKIVQQYETVKEKEMKEEQLFSRMLAYERVQYEQGKKYIAGVDEVGRGPLAGPVVAAAVLLSDTFYLPGLNDSKLLSHKQREKFYDVITSQAISFGIGIIHNEEIDSINIYQATKRAMGLAINDLQPTPEHILIDAMRLDNLPCSSESIVKGDQKSVSIAAASIIAKVTRDRFMEKIHQSYPVYHFASNMGYGTKDHLTALQIHGPCPYHRKSFAPVQQLLEDEGQKI